MSKKKIFILLSTLIILLLGFGYWGYQTGRFKIGADTDQHKDSLINEGEIQAEFQDNEFIVKYKQDSTKGLEADLAGLAKINIKSFEPVFGRTKEIAPPTEGDLNKFYLLRVDSVLTPTEAREAEVVFSKSKDKEKLMKNFVYEKHLELMYYLKMNPDIESVQLNYKYKTSWKPNDPYYTKARSDYRTKFLWNLKKVGMEEAWDKTRGSGIVIAVVDTGVDYNHEDLKDNILRDADGNIIGRNFAYNYESETIDPNDFIDRAGHGTHVAGTIAAVGNNNIGIVGVAPEAKIMPVKGLDDYGSGDSSDLANAIYYATSNGAQVINMSWGGYALPGDYGEELLKTAIDYAYERGIVMVAAAGNGGSNVMDYYPARSEKVITVGALANYYPDLQNTSYSNWGTKLDISAPGDYILSTIPKNIEDIPNDNKVGTQYAYLSGTSMATPHISGLAALVISQHPRWSSNNHEAIKNAITQSARDIVGGEWESNTVSGLYGKDDLYGYGVMHPKKATNFLMPEKVPTARLEELPKMVKTAIDIRGVAAGEGFKKYTLEYRPVNKIKYKKFFESTDAREISQALGTFNNPGDVKDSYFDVRLRVVSEVGGRVSRRSSYDVKSAYVANKQINGFPLETVGDSEYDPIITKLNGQDQVMITGSTDGLKMFDKDNQLTKEINWFGFYDEDGYSVCYQAARPLVLDSSDNSKQKIITFLECSGDNKIEVYNSDFEKEWEYSLGDIYHYVVHSAFYYNGLRTSVAISDINNDNKNEIVMLVKHFQSFSVEVGDFATTIEAIVLDESGNIISRKEVLSEQGGNLVGAGLAIADLNGDSFKEIYFSYASFREDRLQVDSPVVALDHNLNEIWQKKLINLASRQVLIPRVSKDKSHNQVVIDTAVADPYSPVPQIGLSIFDVGGNEVSSFLKQGVNPSDILPVRIKESSNNNYFMYSSIDWDKYREEYVILNKVDIVGNDGQSITGWPKSFSNRGQFAGYAVLAAYLDSDSDIEPVMRDAPAPSIDIVGYKGSEITKFGVTAHIEGGVFADINEDGKVDIVTMASEDNANLPYSYYPHRNFLNGVSAFTLNQKITDELMYWPMKGHDLQNTNAAKPD